MSPRLLAPLLRAACAASAIGWAACADEPAPSPGNPDAADPGDTADTGPATDAAPEPDGSADAALDTTADVEAPDDADDGTDAGSDTDAPPSFEAIAERFGDLGPHRVGFRTDEVTYDPAGADADRTIRLALWYPSDATEGRRPRYFIGATSDLAFEDGELAPLDAPLPVLIYSHGHLGYAEASSRLMEYYASHGWFVVAVNHTGNTSGNFATPRQTPIYHVRSQDLRVALDHLESLDATHPLHGAADTARTVAMGHSFGGYTVLSLVGATWDLDRWESECATTESGFCSQMDTAQAEIFRAGFDDPRVRAAIPMAAGDFDLYGAEGLGDAARPVLHAIGTEDAEALPMWCALAREGNLRLELVGGGHQAFTDACDLPVGPSLGCSEDQIPTADGLRLLGIGTRAFACRAVDACGEDDAWVTTLLDGGRSVDERMVLIQGSAGCD